VELVENEAAPAAGEKMAADIAEQPAVLRTLLTDGAAAIDEVARAVLARRPRFVLLAARGTSDHAALYAKYLVEIRLGLPAGLTSPSTFTVYGARPDLRDVLVIAVSQSGGSPDLVGTVQAARECGALTVAVTNNPASPLAQAAEFGVDVLAGHERAVAATKTYTAELLALYLLLEAIRGSKSQAPAAVPDLVEQLIAESAGPVAALAPRYRFAEQMITTGRGYSYPTAREGALKLMETCYLSALAFSGADLLHGPLAVVDGAMPVIAIVAGGPAGEAMRPVLDRLSAGRADLLVVGGDGGRSVARIALPSVAPELSPVLEIIPIQLLAKELAVARGGDPDAPRGLTKVTETW
jgi:glucosamine--fructose-6-phosphate aminotransferase (isomerizing)